MAIAMSKVLRFHEKHDCRLDDLPLQPPGPGELQCKAMYSAVSVGSDLISYEREFPKGMHRATELGKPISFGYSMAAEILEVGDGVTEFAAGDRIYVWQNHRQFFNVVPGSLGDPSPRKEFWRYEAAKIPDGVSMLEASYLTLIRCSLFAAMKAGIGITHTVVVMGLGMYGQFAVQFARIMGARRIIAIDPIAERVERAKTLGADIGLVSSGVDAVSLVEELTAGRMADSVIDASNGYTGIIAGSDMLRGDGKLVVIGDPLRADLMVYSDRARRAHIDIRGVWIDMMTSNYPQPFYPVTIDEIHGRIFELIQDGRLRIEELVTDIVSPALANDIYARLSQDRSGSLGVVYDWGLLDG